MQIIVKKYEHFNRSLPNWNTPKGVYIKSKDDYDRKLKEAGMVSYEKMQQTVESNRAKLDKPYTASPRALGIVREAIKNADKQGRTKLSGRAADALIEMKAKLAATPQRLKEAKPLKGGMYGK